MKYFFAVSDLNKWESYMKPNQVENVLLSFAFIKEKPKMEQIVKEAKCVFIDSGAHTFNSENKYEKGNYWQYLKEYVSFLKKNWKYIYCYAELDIEQIVGQDEVEEYWKYLVSEGVESKAVRAWHPNYHDFDYFKKICKDSNFVAIGGSWQKHLSNKEVLKLIKYAYDNGVKIHGFGFSGNGIYDYPFFSVDSSSWLQAEIYGSFYKFENGKFICQKSAKKGGRELIHLKNYVDRTRLQVAEYLEYEKFITRLCEKRKIIW